MIASSAVLTTDVTGRPQTVVQCGEEGSCSPDQVFQALVWLLDHSDCISSRAARRAGATIAARAATLM